MHAQKYIDFLLLTEERSQNTEPSVRTIQLLGPQVIEGPI